MDSKEELVQIDSRQQDGRVTVVSPSGRLDMAAAPAFREQVRALVTAGAARLVVDLGDVTFVDSSGLGAVIGGLRLARQAGGDLRIARPTDQVRWSWTSRPSSGCSGRTRRSRRRRRTSDPPDHGVAPGSSSPALTAMRSRFSGGASGQAHAGL